MNLPAGMLIPFAARFRVLSKILSLVIACGFLLPEITWAFDPSNYPNGRAVAQLGFSAQTVSIPEKLGTLLASSPAGPKVVICIQDLHCNYEVQKNIAGLIEHWSEENGLRLVGVEGASGVLETSALKRFPVLAAHMEISDYFVRQGKLSGAEFAALTGSRGLMLWGVETPALYAESLREVRGFLNAESLGLLEEVRASLDELKAPVYSAELRRWDARQTAFREGKLQLVPYAAGLFQEASRMGLDLAGYPALNALLAPAGRNETDPETLFAELDRLEASARSRLYTRPEEAELDQALRRTDVLERLLNISATPGDLREFRARRAEYTVGAFAELGRRLRPGWETDPEWFALDGFLKQAERFYELADQRSRDFAANLLSAMDNRREKIAVVVHGGFHADQMLDELKRRGAAFVSVKPRLTRPDVLNPYFDLLQNKRTPLEKLLEKNQNILSLASRLADPVFLKEYDLFRQATAHALRRAGELTTYSGQAAVEPMNAQQAGALEQFIPGSTWLTAPKPAPNGRPLVVGIFRGDPPRGLSRFLDRVSLFQGRAGFCIYASPDAALQDARAAASHLGPSANWQVLLSRVWIRLRAVRAWALKASAVATAMNRRGRSQAVPARFSPEEAVAILKAALPEFMLGNEKDFEYSAEHIRRLARYPEIHRVWVVGFGLRFWPLLLALTGKQVTFIDPRESPRSILRYLVRAINRYLESKGEPRRIDIAMLGKNLDAVEVEAPGTVNLITAFDLVGPNLNGNPAVMLEKMDAALRPGGYLLLDATPNDWHADLISHWPEYFPGLRQVEADVWKGAYDQDASENYLYQTAQGARRRAQTAHGFLGWLDRLGVLTGKLWSGRLAGWGIWAVVFGLAVWARAKGFAADEAGMVSLGMALGVSASPNLIQAAAYRNLGLPEAWERSLAAQIEQDARAGLVPQSIRARFKQSGLASLGSSNAINLLGSLAPQAQSALGGFFPGAKAPVMAHAAFHLKIHRLFRLIQDGSPDEKDQDLALLVRRQLQEDKRFPELLALYQRQYGNFRRPNGKTDESALLQNMLATYLSNRALGMDGFELETEPGRHLPLSVYWPWAAYVFNDALWRLEAKAGQIAEETYGEGPALEQYRALRLSQQQAYDQFDRALRAATRRESRLLALVKATANGRFLRVQKEIGREGAREYLEEDLAVLTRHFSAVEKISDPELVARFHALSTELALLKDFFLFRAALQLLQNQGVIRTRFNGGLVFSNLLEASRSFGGRLHVWLQATGFEDADLARAAGVKRSIVSSWRHNRKFPEGDKIIRLADFFRRNLHRPISPAKLYYAAEVPELMARAKTFGDRLLILRKLSGLQHKDLGRLLGVVETAVGNWENGLALPGDDAVYAKLAKFFRAKLDTPLQPLELLYGRNLTEFLGSLTANHPLTGVVVTVTLAMRLQAANVSGGNLAPEERELALLDTFGKRLDLLMQAGNISSSELGENVGREAQSVHAWRMGQSLPEGDAVPKLVEFLNRRLKKNYTASGLLLGRALVDQMQEDAALGARLQTLRRLSGLSLPAAAAKIGVHAETLRLWEAEHVLPLDIAAYARLAEVYRTELKDPALETCLLRYGMKTAELLSEDQARDPQTGEPADITVEMRVWALQVSGVSDPARIMQTVLAPENWGTVKTFNRRLKLLMQVGGIRSEQIAGLTGHAAATVEKWTILDVNPTDQPGLIQTLSGFFSQTLGVPLSASQIAYGLEPVAALRAQKRFGERVTVIRKLLGLSPADFAARLETSVGKVLAWERGERLPRDREVLARLVRWCQDTLHEPGADTTLLWFGEPAEEMLEAGPVRDPLTGEWRGSAPGEIQALLQRREEKGQESSRRGFLRLGVLGVLTAVFAAWWDPQSGAWLASALNWALGLGVFWGVYGFLKAWIIGRAYAPGWRVSRGLIAPLRQFQRFVPTSWESQRGWLDSVTGREVRISRQVEYLPHLWQYTLWAHILMHRRWNLPEWICYTTEGLVGLVLMLLPTAWTEGLNRAESGRGNYYRTQARPQPERAREKTSPAESAPWNETAVRKSLVDLLRHYPQYAFSELRAEQWAQALDLPKSHGWKIKQLYDTALREVRKESAGFIQWAKAEARLPRPEDLEITLLRIWMETQDPQALDAQMEAWETFLQNAKHGPSGSFYAFLKVAPDADAETIKKAYRKLSLQFHPDRNPGDRRAEEIFKQLNAAYEVLKDAGKRALYDELFGFSAANQTPLGQMAFGGMMPWLQERFIERGLQAYPQVPRLGKTYETLLAKLKSGFQLRAWMIEALPLGVSMLAVFGALLAAWWTGFLDPATSWSALALNAFRGAWGLFPVGHLIPKQAGRAALRTFKFRDVYASFTREDWVNTGVSLILAAVNLALSFAPVPLAGLLVFSLALHAAVNLGLWLNQNYPGWPELKKDMAVRFPELGGRALQIFTGVRIWGLPGLLRSWAESWVEGLARGWLTHGALPYIPSEGTAAQELLDALELDHARVLSGPKIDPATGLILYRIQTPRRWAPWNPPRGLEVLNNELAPVREFELLFDPEDGQLDAIMPVVAQPVWKVRWGIGPRYFDFTAYGFKLPAFNDFSMEERWAQIAHRRMEKQARLERYKEARGLYLFSPVRHENHSYLFMDMIPELGIPHVTGFEPEEWLDPQRAAELAALIRRSGSHPRLLIPLYPTVYSPARENNFINDHLYLMQVYGRSFELRQHPEAEVMVVGPGSGLDVWLASLGSGLKLIHAVGINPFEIANTRAMARAAGIAVDAKLHDNILDSSGRSVFGARQFDRVFCNAPFFKSSASHLGERLLYWFEAWYKPLAGYADGDHGRFIQGLARGLMQTLKSAEGLGIVWYLDNNPEAGAVFRRAGLVSKIADADDENVVIYELATRVEEKPGQAPMVLNVAAEARQYLEKTLAGAVISGRLGEATAELRNLKNPERVFRLTLDPPKDTLKGILRYSIYRMLPEGPETSALGYVDISEEGREVVLRAVMSPEFSSDFPDGLGATLVNWLRVEALRTNRTFRMIDIQNPKMRTLLKRYFKNVLLPGERETGYHPETMLHWDESLWRFWKNPALVAQPKNTSEVVGAYLEDLDAQEALLLQRLREAGREAEAERQAVSLRHAMAAEAWSKTRDYRVVKAAGVLAYLAVYREAAGLAGLPLKDFRKQLEGWLEGTQELLRTNPRYSPDDVQMFWEALQGAAAQNSYAQMLQAAEATLRMPGAAGKSPGAVALWLRYGVDHLPLIGLVEGTVIGGALLGLWNALFAHAPPSLAGPGVLLTALPVVAGIYLAHRIWGVIRYNAQSRDFVASRVREDVQSAVMAATAFSLTGPAILGLLLAMGWLAPLGWAGLLAAALLLGGVPHALYNRSWENSLGEVPGEGLRWRWLQWLARREVLRENPEAETELRERLEILRKTVEETRPALRSRTKVRFLHVDPFKRIMEELIPGIARELAKKAARDPLFSDPALRTRAAQAARLGAAFGLQEPLERLFEHWITYENEVPLELLRTINQALVRHGYYLLVLQTLSGYKGSQLRQPVYASRIYPLKITGLYSLPPAEGIPVRSLNLEPCSAERWPYALEEMGHYLPDLHAVGIHEPGLAQQADFFARVLQGREAFSILEIPAHQTLMRDLLERQFANYSPDAIQRVLRGMVVEHEYRHALDNLYGVDDAARRFYRSWLSEFSGSGFSFLGRWPYLALASLYANALLNRDRGADRFLWELYQAQQRTRGNQAKPGVLNRSLTEAILAQSDAITDASTMDEIKGRLLEEAFASLAREMLGQDGVEKVGALAKDRLAEVGKYYLAWNRPEFAWNGKFPEQAAGALGWLVPEQGRPGALGFWPRLGLSSLAGMGLAEGTLFGAAALAMGSSLFAHAPWFFQLMGWGASFLATAAGIYLAHALWGALKFNPSTGKYVPVFGRSDILAAFTTAATASLLGPALVAVFVGLGWLAPLAWTGTLLAAAAFGGLPHTAVNFWLSRHERTQPAAENPAVEPSAIHVPRSETPTQNLPSKEPLRFETDAIRMWGIFNAATPRDYDSVQLKLDTLAQLEADGYFQISGTETTVHSAIGELWKQVPEKYQINVKEAVRFFAENLRQHAGNYGILLAKVEEQGIRIAVMDDGPGFHTDARGVPIIEIGEHGGFIQRPDSPGRGIGLRWVLTHSDELTIMSRGHVWRWRQGKPEFSEEPAIKKEQGALVISEIRFGEQPAGEPKTLTREQPGNETERVYNVPLQERSRFLDRAPWIRRVLIGLIGVGWVLVVAPLARARSNPAPTRDLEALQRDARFLDFKQRHGFTQLAALMKDRPEAIGLKSVGNTTFLLRSLLGLSQTENEFYATPGMLRALDLDALAPKPGAKLPGWFSPARWARELLVLSCEQQTLRFEATLKRSVQQARSGWSPVDRALLHADEETLPQTLDETLPAYADFYAEKNYRDLTPGDWAVLFDELAADLNLPLRLTDPASLANQLRQAEALLAMKDGHEKVLEAAESLDHTLGQHLLREFRGRTGEALAAAGVLKSVIRAWISGQGVLPRLPGRALAPNAAVKKLYAVAAPETAAIMRKALQNVRVDHNPELARRLDLFKRLLETMAQPGVGVGTSLELALSEEDASLWGGELDRLHQLDQALIQKMGEENGDDIYSVCDARVRPVMLQKGGAAPHAFPMPVVAEYAGRGRVAATDLAGHLQSGKFNLPVHEFSGRRAPWVGEPALKGLPGQGARAAARVLSLLPAAWRSRLRPWIEKRWAALGAAGLLRSADLAGQDVLQLDQFGRAGLSPSALPLVRELLRPGSYLRELHQRMREHPEDLKRQAEFAKGLGRFVMKFAGWAEKPAAFQAWSDEAFNRMELVMLSRLVERLDLPALAGYALPEAGHEKIASLDGTLSTGRLPEFAMPAILFSGELPDPQRRALGVRGTAGQLTMFLERHFYTVDEAAREKYFRRTFRLRMAAAA